MTSDTRLLFVCLGMVSSLGVTSPSCTEAAIEGFVLVSAGSSDGQPDSTQRVEAFEVLDHQVTNREYAEFVRETGHPTPLHWTDGEIPPGMEGHPVVFVNHSDVRAYAAWLTAKDARAYRLPTTAEFEYAARGGLVGCRYPWGNDPPEGRANYDQDGDRQFDRWQDFLQPARSGEPNGYGLYQMAGNAWHMTVNYNDPATKRWVFRLPDATLLGQSVMGGSWARGADYLRCGSRLGLRPGIRHPDVGFRLVREPSGADWRRQPRRLSALARGDGTVLLSWSLLEQDRRSTRFHVYRSNSRNTAGVRLTDEPVKDATSFLDTGLDRGTRYQYYVRPISEVDEWGRRSEWVGVTVEEQPTAVLATFKPICKPGALVPVFGDLDGDGTLDCVIRMANGNREMSQDPGVPVQLEAFTSYGRSLWRNDICQHDHCYGSANNVPFNVWDMDGDGKAEVITRLQIGDEAFVAILDGWTGQLKHQAPWPPMVTDHYGSSTRIHLSVAYLDGEHPAIVTQTGLYENEVFTAFDGRLKQLWQFNSFGETSGSGGHKIEVADVDGDGKQEVFDGTTCLNSDGSVRWSIYRQHPDIVSVHDYLPDRPGLEVFYIVESSIHAGVYMVDANSGEVIWKVNREDDPQWTHGHYGWTADIWDGSPGIECISNRAGHDDRHVLLFAADGRLLLEPFPYGLTPVEWDGDATRELLGDGGRSLFNFSGTQLVKVPSARPNPIREASLLMVADLCGDFRDELVLSGRDADRQPTIVVVAATEPIPRRFLGAQEDLNYRLWLARNMGGGYKSIYDQTRKSPRDQ